MKNTTEERLSAQRTMDWLHLMSSIAVLVLLVMAIVFTLQRC